MEEGKKEEEEDKVGLEEDEKTEGTNNDTSSLEQAEGGRSQIETPGTLDQRNEEKSDCPSY